MTFFLENLERPVLMSRMKTDFVPVCLGKVSRDGYHLQGRTYYAFKILCLVPEHKCFAFFYDQWPTNSFQWLSSKAMSGNFNPDPAFYFKLEDFSRSFLPSRIRTRWTKPMRIHAVPDAQHRKKLWSSILIILSIINENYQHLVHTRSAIYFTGLKNTHLVRLFLKTATEKLFVFCCSKA